SNLMHLAQKMILDYQRDRLYWNLNTVRGQKHIFRLRHPINTTIQDVLNIHGLSTKDLTPNELKELNEILSNL
ncbi:MAG: hypothetical protein RLZZ223_35, partial [Candidatus Parcubacteria bacterium]